MLQKTRKIAAQNSRGHAHVVLTVRDGEHRGAHDEHEELMRMDDERAQKHSNQGYNWVLMSVSIICA